VSGCWQTWTEQDAVATVRTQMENQAPKVRRRFTGVLRHAQASVTLRKAELPAWLTWFRVNCQQGVLPTAMREPSGVEAVWRFAEPLTVEWMEPHTGLVRVSARLERLPGWQEI
jgi:hypothetical protein